MNDEVRVRLGEIVARHGLAVAEDPRRCGALLRDYAGQYRREIFVLVSALEEGVAEDLLGARGRVPPSLLVGQLVRRLTDRRALADDAARWAVESWALALGVELAALEPPPAPKPPAAAPQSEPAPRVPEPPATQQRAPTSLSPRLPSEVMVDALGGGDFATVGEAVANAPHGARIVVRPGTYDESLVLSRHVEIVGAKGAGEVVIRSATSSCVRMETDSATLSGLTLQRVGGAIPPSFAVDILSGELVLDGCDISSRSLACIAIHGTSARPHIRRCVVHDGADAGIFVFDGGGGLIEECEIRGSENVGVAITTGGDPRLLRCRVYDGRNAGIVSWDHGRGRVEECDVFGNRQAGIGVSSGGSPQVLRSQIYSSGNAGVFVHDGGLGEFSDCDIFDHAEAEVAISRTGNPVLRDCKIHGGLVGVLVTDGGAGTFIGCEITDNSTAGVAIRASDGLTMSRCAIRANSGVGVAAEEGASATLEECDVRGNLGGPWQVDVTSMLRAPGTRER